MVFLLIRVILEKIISDYHHRKQYKVQMRIVKTCLLFKKAPYGNLKGNKFMNMFTQMLEPDNGPLMYPQAIFLQQRNISRQYLFHFQYDSLTKILKLPEHRSLAFIFVDLSWNCNMINNLVDFECECEQISSSMKDCFESEIFFNKLCLEGSSEWNLADWYNVLCL